MALSINLGINFDFYLSRKYQHLAEHWMDVMVVIYCDGLVLFISIYWLLADYDKTYQKIFVLLVPAHSLVWHCLDQALVPSYRPSQLLQDLREMNKQHPTWNNP